MLAWLLFSLNQGKIIAVERYHAFVIFVLRASSLKWT
jgi:hypothetical protein